MKTKLITGLLSLFLVITCFGCSQKKSHNKPITNNNKDTVYLKFFGNKYEAINTIAIENILQDYMKDHPNINITYESVKGTDYFNILEKRLETGNYDDIFMINEDYLKKYKTQGYFEDVSELSTISNYSQKSIEQMTEEDGKIFYLPTTISAFGLYCNMDLLKKHNQKVPQNNQEFMAVCQYFVDQGITPIIANNDISLKTIVIAKGLYPVYQSSQTEQLIQEINQDSQVFSQYLKPGYEYVQQLIDKKYVDVDETLKTTKTKEDLEIFEKGENPFMLTGAWAAERIQNATPNLNFEVHPYPILDNGSVLVTNMDTRICVNAKGKHVQEAKDFVEYMTQNDVLWNFVNNQSSFSPLNESRLADNKAIQPLNTYLTDKKSILGTNSNIKYKTWDLTRQGVLALLNGEGIEAALKITAKSK